MQVLEGPAEAGRPQMPGLWGRLPIATAEEAWLGASGRAPQECPLPQQASIGRVLYLERRARLGFGVRPTKAVAATFDLGADEAPRSKGNPLGLGLL